MLKNKFLNILLICCGMICTWGCKENVVLGLQSDDTTPPDLPVVTEVKNINGGAIIYYDVPKAEDLLCVSTNYTINGKEYTKRTSPYVDSVIVDGFGQEQKYTVRLKSVDKYKNESEEMSVEIEPKESPLQLIYKSIKMTPAFGGIRITWDNPTEANVILGVMKKDSIGEWKLFQNIYTNAKNGVYTLRGMDAVEQEFGVYVRDRWDNYSDKIEDKVIPLFEEFIHPRTFRELNPAMFDDCDVNRNNPVRQMWDGNKNLRGFCSRGDMPIERQRFVTFDLGVLVKLSRYTAWQRTAQSRWIYSHYNWKYYDIYGCAELTPEMREKGTLDGWTLLYKAQTYKPSGDGPVTNEDRQYILKGDSHEFPLDIPAIRYIRIDMIESFQQTAEKGICELEFWGQYIK